MENFVNVKLKEKAGASLRGLHSKCDLEENGRRR